MRLPKTLSLQPNDGLVNLAACFLCCATLVFGGGLSKSASWGRTMPASSESEEESRQENTKGVEETAAVARSRGDHRDFATRQAARMVRKYTATTSHIRLVWSYHVFTECEHDLQNGIGAPLLC